MGGFFSDVWYGLVALKNTVNPQDAIDILIVAYLIYKAIQFVRETRAELLIKGIGVLIVANLISELLSLRVMHFVMGIIFQYGVLVLFVLFQPELRRALEQVGRSKISRIPVFNADNDKNAVMRNAIKSACEAARELQLLRMGALIVFERETKLGDVTDTGTAIDAAVSKALLGNLFFNKAPLHDGAVVIRDGKVAAAGCILPLSDNTGLSDTLGTRHRAALGVSEVSDAVVVVVSEETGIISIAQNGVLTRDLSRERLYDELESALLKKVDDDEEKPSERKGKKK